MDIKIFCTAVSLLLLVLISTVFSQPHAKKWQPLTAPISTNSGRYSNVDDYYTKVTNAEINSTTERYSGKASISNNDNSPNKK